MISAIIPVYNEGNTLGTVLSVVTKCTLIDEIIIVNDGSKDDTGNVAKSFNVTVINLAINKGKAAAIKEGLKVSNGDIILLLDGDLIGLTEYHVFSLLQPLINKEADMVVGKFSEGRFLTTLSQKITPFLSGQRALKRRILEEIKDLEELGYGIETALTLHVNSKKYVSCTVFLETLSHIMKEEKRGFLAGFLSRMKMYYDIIKAFYKYSILGL